MTRAVFAIAGALAALWAGAWAGAATGPVARADRELAPAAGAIAVGDSLEVGGQPVQLSLFYTTDPPERVAQFYARAFAARGVLPVVSRAAGFAHASAFDPRDGLQRFVTAVPQPGGSTLVMTGLANPRRPPRLTRGAAEAGFPLPPGTRAFLGYRSTDASGAAESGQFVTALSPSSVLAFYRRALGERGWSERPADDGATVAVFARGAEVLSVAAQALDGQGGAAVFVNRTDGASR